eukprot:10603426-Alexandrium_andersonii.AAC.1
MLRRGTTRPSNGLAGGPDGHGRRKAAPNRAATVCHKAMAAASAARYLLPVQGDTCCVWGAHALA